MMLNLCDIKETGDHWPPAYYIIIYAQGAEHSESCDGETAQIIDTTFSETI